MFFFRISSGLYPRLPDQDLYPHLPNYSLRPASWFHSEGDGLSRRTVTTERKATPTHVYSAPDGTVKKQESGGNGKMMWIKLGVFLVVAIFVFMLLKRMAEGEEVQRPIEEEYKSPDE